MSQTLENLRVMLVDDHTLFRAGVRTLIERDLDARVIAECDTGDDALRSLGKELADVAMVDISLRNEDGIELARRIVTQFEGSVKCIMLSMHMHPGYVKRAFDAGARGYVVKDAGPVELTAAIRAVVAGQRYVSPSASDALLQHTDPTSLHNTLSPRQLEVLRKVAEGKSTKIIARELGLSTKTVDSHRYQISQRLQVHDVAGMVRYAIRHSLVGNE